MGIIKNASINNSNLTLLTDAKAHDFSKVDKAFVFGLIAVLLLSLPTLILGGNGTVNIHDQLDGEVLAYKIRALHIFDDGIPEFMVSDKNALTPASYGTLIFYILLSPATAFVSNYFFVQMMAYIGLYLVLKEFQIDRVIALVTSVLFCMLPFYSVYGLSVMGQPLLLYACITAYKGKKVIPYLITILFAAFSSPVLVGFADCAIILFTIIVMYIQKRKSISNLWKVFIVLILTYVSLNYSLFKEVFVNTSFTSHKSEYIAGILDGWVQSFLTIWKYGMYHAVSNHSVMIPWIIASILVLLILYPVLSALRRNHLRILLVLFAGTIAISALYATWHCKSVVELRDKLGGLFITFQIDRFYWLFPCLWYISFGIVLDIIYRPNIFNSHIFKTDFEQKNEIFSKCSSLFICSLLVISVAVPTFVNSSFKNNVEYLFDGVPSTAVTFNNFYSEPLFDEISDYINLPKDKYKVGSVALYPSIPLYNGFYCIDGYSNNYDVKYKHQFRRIISEELNKDDSIKSYFDTWGNRCYLFSSEIGMNYYFTKDSTDVIKNLNLNNQALKDLDCDYIFSSLEIQNAQASGLEFMKTFERSDCSYKIWLYRVE